MEKRGMEKVYSWLFGESKWQQKKKLKKLLCVTGIMVVIAVLMLFDDPWLSVGVVVVDILIWGWNFVRATAEKVSKITEALGNDVVIFVITVMYWIAFAMIGGVISLILGIIRFIQIWND